MVTDLEIFHLLHNSLTQVFLLCNFLLQLPIAEEGKTMKRESSEW